MTKTLSGNACLSGGAIRKFVLSGRSLWSAIAFGTLGVAATLFLLMTILHSLDTAIGLYQFVPEFNFYLHSNSSGLLKWLASVVTQFDNARGGQTFTNFGLGGVMIVLVLVLFIAHYRRFSHPKGLSLTESTVAGNASRSLLASFGHFTDIQVPIANDGMVSNDFLSIGRIFYAPPKGQVSRILKGKPAENQNRVLTFFMAHEYAHAVTKDNLANSVFLVLTSIFVFVFLSIMGPVLFISSTMVTASPIGSITTVPLSIIVFLILCSAVGLCFHGMLISYIKAREFFCRPSGLFLCARRSQPPLSPAGNCAPRQMR